MDWVKSAEISHFEAGSDYLLYPIIPLNRVFCQQFYLMAFVVVSF
jgi:hypothetical protein